MRKHVISNKQQFPLATVIITIIALPLIILNLHQPEQPKQQTVEAAGQVAWPVFDGDQQKSGTNNSEPLINKTTLTTLKQLWQVQISAADGSPVYLSGVTTAQGTKNLVYITSKEGALTAFDETNGKQIWSKTTSGGAGITTSSPAIDPNHQFIYSYGKDGKVHKYEVGTGNEQTTGGWPLTATLIPDVEKGSSALAIGNGYLYVTISAYNGDEGSYVGHIVGKNLTSGTVSVFNVLCADNKQLIGGTCSSQKAGVWARPGAVVDPSTGNVFISSGNGSYAPPRMLGDSIIELSADLSKIIDTYTPQNYDQLDSQDEDLGSAVTAIVPGINIGIQGGKDNKVRVLNLKNLSGQTGPYHTGGELQTLSVSCNIFSHPISWVNSGTTWVFVTDMCDNLYAYKVTGTNLQQVYNKGSIGRSSPLMINGILFVQTNGAIKAVDPTTGNELWNGQVGSMHWQSPAVINGHVFVIDDDGKLTAFGVPNAPANPTTNPQPSNTNTSPPFNCLGSCPTLGPTQATNPNPSNTSIMPSLGTNPSALPSLAAGASQQPLPSLIPGGNGGNNGNILQLFLGLLLAIIAFIMRLFSSIF